MAYVDHTGTLTDERYSQPPGSRVPMNRWVFGILIAVNVAAAISLLFSVPLLALAPFAVVAVLVLTAKPVKSVRQAKAEYRAGWRKL